MFMIRTLTRIGSIMHSPLYYGHINLKKLLVEGVLYAGVTLALQY